jgi:general secretion pathway protein C
MTPGLALSPRQTRTALDLLTGAMVVSVAFALAGLTWRIAGHAGTGAVTVPSGRSAPGAIPNIAPVIALAPFGKSTSTDASQPTGLPLTLQGVVAADPASLSTAFIAVSGQPSAPFRIGQNVGGATIQGILRDRVILSNGGRTEYLAFPAPNPTPTPGAPAQPGQLNNVAPVGVPAPVSNAAPPPAQAQPGAGANALLQRFNATPANGGYRIGNAALPGLAVGDVLMSVNGTSLGDPNAAGAAFAAAQSAGSATLQIQRDGKRLTLTVPLR